MPYLYSKTTGGFYPVGITYPNMPTDTVSVTDATYAALFTSQDQGMVIGPDANGNPVATAVKAS